MIMELFVVNVMKLIPIISILSSVAKSCISIPSSLFTNECEMPHLPRMRQSEKDFRGYSLRAATTAFLIFCSGVLGQGAHHSAYIFRLL